VRCNVSITRGKKNTRLIGGTRAMTHYGINDAFQRMDGNWVSLPREFWFLNIIVSRDNLMISTETAFCSSSANIYLKKIINFWKQKL